MESMASVKFGNLFRQSFIGERVEGDRVGSTEAEGRWSG